MGKYDEIIRTVGSAEGEALWTALRTQHPPVLQAATYNRKLTDDQALYIAKNRNAPAEALGFLAGDVRFKKSYKLQLALCCNAKTPMRIVMALLKFIKVFDLADITRNKFIHSITRQKVSFMLSERIPSMPAGIKIALSRRASAEIIVKLMERSEHRVIGECLESGRLTEDIIVMLVQKSKTKGTLVKAVASHAKWSLRYRIRYALFRNFHTPLTYLEECLPLMKTVDLRDLYSDKGVSASSKPFIHRELLRRDKDIVHPEDVVHELHEDDDEVLSGEDMASYLNEEE
jgi:hypothetical protein